MWLSKIVDEKSIPPFKMDTLWTMGDSIPDLVATWLLLGSYSIPSWFRLVSYLVPTPFLAPMTPFKFRPLDLDPEICRCNIPT
jgi:hypothetical protein